mmetsp:Transcript_13227/g.31301  ORF Transcript_13227/g.31301 Transcript_13227/m.31301 type:complete len:219 (-) Transcript_13227:9-665(-)
MEFPSETHLKKDEQDRAPIHHSPSLPCFRLYCRCERSFSGGATKGPALATWSLKKWAWRTWRAWSRSSSRSTSEMFTLDAPWESISTWISSFARISKTWAMTSELRLTLAMRLKIDRPSCTRTCAMGSFESSAWSLESFPPVFGRRALRSLTTLSTESRRSAPRVRETDTSDVATTSTLTWWRSKMEKTVAKKPYCPSIRVETTFAPPPPPKKRKSRS